MSSKHKTYKDIKICCYAIAANEPESFIDRWLKSMSGADYIAVLITQENNSNWDYFCKKKSEYPQLIVEQKTISPWRFDTARNESMKLIPADCDVIVCTDIDEIVIEDFWDDLRKCVFEHPNFERIYYRYAWSHSDSGEPKWVFWYDKITQPKGWKWQYPVHEALVNYEGNYSGCYNMNKDKIYLHHYPDFTKSRSSYLKLLELRANEYPEDLYGLFYLAREYSFVRNYRNALKTAYNLYTRLCKDVSRDDMCMLPSVCCLMGDFSYALGERVNAEIFYQRALEVDNSFRTAYIKLAQLYAYKGEYDKVYSTINDMNKYSVYKEDWRMTTYHWRKWKVNQIIADAKCWEGKYKEAMSLFEEALKDIKTNDDKQDARQEGFYEDIAFLKTKLGLK